MKQELWGAISLAAWLVACSSSTQVEDTGETGGAGQAGSGGSSTGGEGGETGGGTTSGGTVSGGTSTGGEGTGGSPLPPKLGCADEQIDHALDAPGASTAGGDDELSLSCGAGSAPEVLYDFTAPATDYYTLSTKGSTFDTVLGILEGDCATETELACDDDGSQPQSELVHRFIEGDRYLIAVDGKLDSDGDVALSIEPVTCPEQDVRGQTPPFQLSTVGGSTDHGGECGGSSFAEKAVRWVPPRSGLYRFSASSEQFDPAVYLERGPRCNAANLLGCNTTGNDVVPSAVTRRLTAGEPVTVIVDGSDGQGTFSLDIEELSTQCPMWSSFVEADPIDKVITLDDPDVLTPSCAPRGFIHGFENQGFVAPDHTIGMHIGEDGLLKLELLFTANAPFVAYVLEGTDCSGAQVHCEIGEMTGASGDPMPYSRRIEFTPDDFGDYVVVIEPTIGLNEFKYSIAKLLFVA